MQRNNPTAKRASFGSGDSRSLWFTEQLAGQPTPMEKLLLWRGIARIAVILIIGASGCSAGAQEETNGKPPADSWTGSAPKTKRNTKPARADLGAGSLDRVAPDRENPVFRWDGFYGGGNVGAGN